LNVESAVSSGIRISHCLVGGEAATDEIVDSAAVARCPWCTCRWNEHCRLRQRRSIM